MSQNMSPLMGRWNVELHYNGKRGYVPTAADDHRGPSFVFPIRVPAQGDLVAAWAGWDVCQNTGKDSKRPTLKREVRVKPIIGQPKPGVTDQEIRIGTLAEAGENRKRWLDDDLYLYATNTAPDAITLASINVHSIPVWLSEEIDSHI